MARHLALAVSLLLVAVLLAGACNSSSGQAQCEAAGGQCVLGSAWCSNRGPQDCNPDRNPGGAFCCLSGLCTAPPVQAAKYDQTCTIDSDCVAVAEGNACNPCDFSCANAAINVSSLRQYTSDTANILPAAYQQCPSSCGGPQSTCCRSGRCQRGYPSCPYPGTEVADAGDAGQDGGRASDGSSE